MTTWYCLDLEDPGLYIRPGEMVVVRLGSLSFREATYRVGYFATDPREPDARKLWFYRSGGGIEDPAAGRNITPISASCRWIRRREV